MKTALITGASSGIGKELAFVYAENGYQLILTARRLSNLEEIKAEIKKKHDITAVVIKMDLSQSGSADKLYQEVVAKKLQVDVLINNAGFGQFGNYIEQNTRQEEQMLMLNIVSLVKLSKLFALEMQKRKTGDIVHIASNAAFQPVPTMAAYAASKAFVLHFAEATAMELKEDGIRVSAICPGATQSEFDKVAKMNPDFFANAPSSRELAEFTFKKMSTRKTVAVQGFVNRISAWAVPFVPRKWIMNIAKSMMR